MRRNLAIVLFALLTLISKPALGDAGWTDFGYVTELTSTNQFHYLVTLNISDNPSDCRNKHTFYQDFSMSGSSQMFRILLEAVKTGQRVRVYVTGNCEINGYSEISSVSIIPR